MMPFSFLSSSSSTFFFYQGVIFLYQPHGCCTVLLTSVAICARLPGP